jgi:hypothetical protein
LVLAAQAKQGKQSRQYPSNGCAAPGAEALWKFRIHFAEERFFHGGNGD